MSRSEAASGAMEQLMLLRDMSDTTGVLHEAQVLQLRHYPAMVAKWRYEVAVSPEPRLVWVDFRPGAVHLKPKKFMEKCARMCGWVKTLLGPSWEVKVTVRGELVHLSERKMEVADVRTHRPRLEADGAAGEAQRT